MFRVITLAREFGSGGGAIARSIAQRLGWKLVDKSLVEDIARAAHVDVETARRCDETIDSWWHRMNRCGLWSAALSAGAAPTDATFFDAETMAALARTIITDAAAKGSCVIVGRGAQCVLQNRPDVLHVFVYAPLRKRAARIRLRAGTNKDLEKVIHSTDAVRAAHIRRYFGCDWKDPHLYQLMIDSQLGAENVVRSIVDVVESTELRALLQSFAV